MKKMEYVRQGIRFLISVVALFSVCALAGFSQDEEPGYSEYSKSPRDIIVQAYTHGGMPSEIMDSMTVPEFTLYGDGRLIILRADQKHNRVLMETRLDEPAMELLLKYLEQQGYWQFNENYLNLTEKDLPTTDIMVNTRKEKKSIMIYGLAMSAQQDMLPRGLSNIYQKLIEYDAPDMKLYDPESITLFVMEAGKSSIPEKANIVSWKAKHVDLTKLIHDSGSPLVKYKENTLVKDEKKNAVNFLRGKTLYENQAGFLNTFFKCHRRFFRVAFRPHLPYESLEDEKESEE